MPSPLDAPAEEDRSAPADSGLRCPQCDYNLTGLTENRCPECGSAFDRDELLRLLAAEAAPIPGWDDRGKTNFLVAFFRVCWTMWFDPGRFAASFPWAFDPQPATRFWLLARAVAVGILWGGAAIIHCAAAMLGAELYRYPEEVFFYLAIAWGACVGSLVCEASLVIFLKLLVKPRVVFRLGRSLNVSVSWWGFVGFYSSFLVVSALLCGLLASILFVSLPADRSSLLGLFWLAVIACLGWWWGSLGTGILARSRPTWGRTVAIFCIPVSAAIGIVAGFLAVACCASGFRY